MVHGERADGLYRFYEFSKRYEGVCRGADVEFGEDGRVFIKLWKRLDDDIVLVDLSINKRDLVIRIGPAEIGLYCLGSHVVVRGFVSKDMKRPLGLVVEKIA